MNSISWVDDFLPQSTSITVTLKWMSSVNGFPVIPDTYARVLRNSKRCTGGRAGGGEQFKVTTNTKKLNVFSFRLIDTHSFRGKNALNQQWSISYSSSSLCLVLYSWCPSQAPTVQLWGGFLLSVLWFLRSFQTAVFFMQETTRRSVSLHKLSHQFSCAPSMFDASFSLLSQWIISLSDCATVFTHLHWEPDDYIHSQLLFCYCSHFLRYCDAATSEMLWKYNLAGLVMYSSLMHV